MRTIRQKGIEAGYGHEPGFRWRGSEVARLEGLSDAVFAFAVTLLVVSLEVPRTFDELLGVMSGFPAFGACFTLLFLVLFYIYPLKFMFTSLFQQMLGWGSRTAQSMPPIQVGQARTLMLVYSAGFLGVFVVFVLMYLHAWPAGPVS